MARLPTVAIVGRPNTGKSTLFNRFIGRRKSIVSEVPGTTRDHIAQKIETDEVDYLLLDTGGIGGGTDDEDLEGDVERQSLLAVENADLILLTLNSQEELTSSDFAVVEVLRKKRKNHVPVILVLTKCDDAAKIEFQLPQYYELGIADEIIPVSAAHNVGTEDLQSAVTKRLVALHFTKQIAGQEGDQMPKIAVIGKPNVGKSSLINAFMSETQRTKSPLLVSEIPGTTRDATDTIVKFHDRELLFIDTAGIKRRKSTEAGIEVFAYLRSIRALQDADIGVLVLDATEVISKMDKRIAGLAIEEGKGLIILINKIDRLNAEQRALKITEVERSMNFCRFAPVLPCSAETREGLLKLFDLIEMVQRNRTRHLPTKDLNNWFRDAVYGQPLGSIAQSKHITQADEVPPTFVLFVKDPKKVPVSQLKFLDNNLRKFIDFTGTPIRWITKASS